jgi:hypothetical protein
MDHIPRLFGVYTAKPGLGGEARWYSQPYVPPVGEPQDLETLFIGVAYCNARGAVVRAAYGRASRDHARACTRRFAPCVLVVLLAPVGRYRFVELYLGCRDWTSVPGRA